MTIQSSKLNQQFFFITFYITFITAAAGKKIIKKKTMDEISNYSALKTGMGGG